MAEVKIIIDKEEREEMEDVEKIMKGLKKNERIKLLGFLKGLNFAKGEMST